MGEGRISVSQTAGVVDGRLLRANCVYRGVADGRTEVQLLALRVFLSTRVSEYNTDPNTTSLSFCVCSKGE